MFSLTVTVIPNMYLYFSFYSFSFSFFSRYQKAAEEASAEKKKTVSFTGFTRIYCNVKPHTVSVGYILLYEKDNKLINISTFVFHKTWHEGWVNNNRFIIFGLTIFFTHLTFKTSESVQDIVCFSSFRRLVNVMIFGLLLAPSS